MDYNEYPETLKKQREPEMTEIHYARGLFNETLTLLFSFMHG
jgi:hypothetical protein